MNNWLNIENSYQERQKVCNDNSAKRIPRYVATLLPKNFQLQAQLVNKRNRLLRKIAKNMSTILWILSIRKSLQRAKLGLSWEKRQEWENKEFKRFEDLSDP